MSGRLSTCVRFGRVKPIASASLAFDLLLEIAACSEGASAARALSAATAMLPIVRWDVGDLARLVSTSDPPDQRRSLDLLLQRLILEERGRPHGPLERVFPLLLDLGGNEADDAIWWSLWEATSCWP